MQGSDRLEEQPVSRHRVVGARTRENQPVVAAEGRHQNRRRHQRRAAAGHDDIERGRRHAVRRRVLNRRQWKRHQVRDVGQQVEQNHQPGATEQAQWQITARVLDFAGGEGDVVPGIGGEERIRLRHTDADEETEGGHGT
jgi:hypothetical protein